MPFLTFFGITEEQKEVLEPILIDIAAVDDTFIYEVFPASYGTILVKESKEAEEILATLEVKFIVKIESKRNKQAYRRGVWLVHKTNIPHLRFWVKHDRSKKKGGESSNAN